MNKPLFTVIIPNYNGLRYMERCMEALRHQSYTSFAVLIVDNGSTDGSVEYLKALESEESAKLQKAVTGSDEEISGDARATAAQAQNSSGASLDKNSSDRDAESARRAAGLHIRNIFLDTNTGFSGAVNVGIAAADTEYVVLLNNDTEAEPDYLKEIARIFEKDKCRKIFAVSPLMIQLYHKELIDDAGDGYNLLGWGFQRGVGQAVTTAKFAHETKVFSACAGAAAYRRSVLEEIAFPGEKDAYFDPMHFAYLEDIDVSFRARIHGYDIIYAPASRVYHVGSGTSGSKYNAFKVRLAARNNVYLNYKNMPSLMLLINLPGIICGVIIKQLFFIKRGFGREYLQGFMEGIRTLSQCRRHRTHFKAGRLLTYIKIECMLIADTFSYVQDFMVRRAGRKPQQPDTE